MKKIFEYNRKLEMFKNVMWEDFSNVSRFLLDPISGKHMEAFDKKIIPLKQAINLLSAMWVKPNDPQMIEKTQELNRELYLLRNTYGEKRVADFMQSINQRIDRMNARSSWGQSSWEQSWSSSYRAKTEKPQPQKTPEQMQNERVNRISKLSLQQIREEMLILKRDIKSFYWDGKDRGYIEIEINECETTLEKAKKSYNDNDFWKGTRLFDIWKKRTEDLEKKLTNVYDKIQDYFVYTARIKEIWLDKDVQELQLDEKSINPTRFKQFISDVSNLKNMSQEIDKLAQNATKSKPWTDRIYAWF